MYRKWIVYQRASDDFALFLDGQLLGYARSYQEAEAVFDQFYMELLRSRHTQRVA